MSDHLSESRTEDLIRDLLTIQGWSFAKPPKGNVVRKNEYKSYAELEDIFKGSSKKGPGEGYPDFLVIDKQTRRPLAIIEAKAGEGQLNQANTEACFYGSACIEAGHNVIAIGVAGQEDTNIYINAFKYVDGKWKPIQYNENPISWIPTPGDIDILYSSAELVDLAPVVPSPEVLAEQADIINRILREANIKDEYRPAYVGAMMLGLWKSRGAIRRGPEYILRDINLACADAFKNAKKEDLGKSLRIDEANDKLANSAWRILSILQKLNVITPSFSHDYLGHLYEAFFRYTGGNTIGQYFTPRHITRFMADICETTPTDIVIDPACGTGGFLVACIQRAFDHLKLRYEDVIKMVENQLIGYESEPVTAALCVANMILRGDGKTGVHKDDCFSAADYPINRCTVALMNPPFPHEATDTPSQKFVERALEALNDRGKLAVVLPTSILVKKVVGDWRKSILARNTLLAVCQLPDEIFQPYASATTSVILLEKGVPHNSVRKTVFVRIEYDGLILKKGIRVPRQDGFNQVKEAAEAIINKSSKPGFSGRSSVSGTMEWSVGAYIPSAVPTESELKASIDELLRRMASFYVRYAPEIANQRNKIKLDEISVVNYRDIMGVTRLNNAKRLPKQAGTIGQFFDIFYGQKELHSRDGIPSGDSLIISPTEGYNGCYGWLNYAPLLKAPFVTVAQTGTIGEAFLQLEHCGVNDDCLILLPKEGEDLPLSCLVIASAIIRLQRWRFSYGRKLTPARICAFPMIREPGLEQWVGDRLREWEKVQETVLKTYDSKI